MMVFILCVTVVGIIFLLCYGGWWWGQNISKKKVDPHIEAMTKLNQNKNDILAFIYDEAKARRKKPVGSASLKISILESLNVSPEDMKKCLKELIDSQLVIESKDSVSLTSFGVQTYEVFIKRKK